MEYVWIALIGFVAGLIARAIHPGKDDLGLIMTAVLGIAGSYLASFIGQAVGWYKAGQGTGFIGAVVGAVLLLVVFGFIKRKSSGGGGGTPT